jgi:hypothetical protein
LLAAVVVALVVIVNVVQVVVLADTELPQGLQWQLVHRSL